MTPNKRNKNKTRAKMAATGTNYVRAARAAASKALKDPARLSWSPGTIACAEKPIKVVDSFAESDVTHLLITGMSAAEPEDVLIDMINQISASNTPEDAKFWMIEPSIPLAPYKDSTHVARYMDSWTPNCEFTANAADMMTDAVKEMDRRNRMFVNHSKSPKKLAKAREIAIRESKQNGTLLEDHPLWVPYIFIVIHECSPLFSDSVKKEERDDQGRFIVAAAEIARKARSAGIFLVMSTQYGVPEAVPLVISDQMRKIALSMPSEDTSQLVIGDDSLFGLPKTKGIIVNQGEGENLVFDRNPIRY